VKFHADTFAFLGLPIFGTLKVHWIFGTQTQNPRRVNKYLLKALAKS